MTPIPAMMMKAQPSAPTRSLTAIPTREQVFAEPSLFDALPPHIQDALYEEIAVLEARLRAKVLTRKDAGPGKSQDADRLLPVPEAAQRLGLKAGRLYELIRQGRFPAVAIGKYVRLRESDVRSFMKTGARGSRDGNLSDGDGT